MASQLTQFSNAFSFAALTCDRQRPSRGDEPDIRLGYVALRFVRAGRASATYADSEAMVDALENVLAVKLGVVQSLVGVLARVGWELACQSVPSRWRCTCPSCSGCSISIGTPLFTSASMSCGCLSSEGWQTAPATISLFAAWAGQRALTGPARTRSKVILPP